MTFDVVDVAVVVFFLLVAGRDKDNLGSGKLSVLVFCRKVIKGDDPIRPSTARNNSPVAVPVITIGFNSLPLFFFFHRVVQ